MNVYVLMLMDPLSGGDLYGVYRTAEKARTAADQMTGPGAHTNWDSSKNLLVEYRNKENGTVDSSAYWSIHLIKVDEVYLP